MHDYYRDHIFMDGINHLNRFFFLHASVNGNKLCACKEWDACGRGASGQAGPMVPGVAGASNIYWKLMTPNIYIKLGLVEELKKVENLPLAVGSVK